MNKGRIAIIGTGPSGLMTAYIAAQAGWQVDLFEKNSGIGRKILIAGSSGFNIGNNSTINEFVQLIEHDGDSKLFLKHLNQFFTDDWIAFLKKLDVETFLGTSNRYFTKEMHAAFFLKNFLQELEKLRVQIFLTKNLTKINPEKNHSYSLTFSDGETHGPYPYLCLNLGGGSWEDQEVEWPKMMINLGLEFIPFFSANAGFHVKEWTKELIQEIKLQPIKDCTLKTSKGEKRGDLIVTEYGLEGTPVYFVGRPEVVYIDFFPKLKLEQLDVKLLDISSKENLNHLRKIKKMFPNHQALHGILFHLNKNINSLSANELSKLLKNFPLTLEKIRPLREAISSKGGISLKECDENLMSVKYPGMFMAGEMLNWSAPTGGYLIQTCVTQGYIVGKALARRYP